MTLRWRASSRSRSLHPAGQPPTLLHSSGYHLNATSNLNLYVRAADVGRRLSAFEPGRAYTVRATLVLDTGTGGQSGDWSPAFIEGVFPACERSHSITRRIGV